MKSALFVVLLVFVQFAAKAQMLPEFPPEDGIVRGSLPCGASYYLFHNDCAKGYAEYSLVQKNYQNIAESRTSLAHGRDFSNEPYRFFASKGVRYDRRGFISYPENSTVYRFRNVPLYDAATNDSTLLLIFDLMRHCPTGQSVMISGDIDVNAVADRLRVLSLTVGKLAPASESKPYMWSPKTKLTVNTTVSRSEMTGHVTVRIASPRTPVDKLNTVVPLVSRIYARELGIILQNRVRRAFYEACIPIADFFFGYKDSSFGPSDEQYWCTVHTRSDKLQDAAFLLSSIIAGLDSQGASEQEYSAAKSQCLYELGERKLRDGNSVYISKFISNYLYGTSLSSDKLYYDFVSKKNLAPDVELSLFNNFVSALLDSNKSTTLEMSNPRVPFAKDVCRKSFEAGWSRAHPYVPNQADTLKLVQPKGRVKVKTEEVNSSMGSVMWTFTNGLKVLYKKDESAKKVSVAFLFRGGSVLEPSLASGEAGFVSDMPKLYKVAGIDALDFAEMLQSNGIFLQSEVEFTNFKIKGHAPKEKLPMLLSAVASFVTRRETDKRAFDYYKQCEALRLDMRRHSLAYLDDLAENSYHDSFKFKECREIDALKDDLPRRSEKYFASQLSKATDGMIVIVGNIEQAELQKMLSRYLSVFKYSEKISFRPKLKDAEVDGWYTVYRDGKTVGLSQAVRMALKTGTLYSKEAEMTLSVARLYLAKEITSRLSPLGYYAEVKEIFELYPSEASCIEITAAPAMELGLPAGVYPHKPKEVLDVLRETIKDASNCNLRPQDIEAFKKEVLGRALDQSVQPDYIVDAVLKRAIFGKNVFFGIKESANAVTADKVRSLLSSLAQGPRVEVVVL